MFRHRGGGGRLEGTFFFQVVFGVESGQSMSTWIVDSGLCMQVLFGRVLPSSVVGR